MWGLLGGLLQTTQSPMKPIIIMRAEGTSAQDRALLAAFAVLCAAVCYVAP